MVYTGQTEYPTKSYGVKWRRTSVGSVKKKKNRTGLVTHQEKW